MWYCMKDVTVARLLVGVNKGGRRALFEYFSPVTDSTSGQVVHTPPAAQGFPRQLMKFGWSSAALLLKPSRKWDFSHVGKRAHPTFEDQRFRIWHGIKNIIVENCVVGIWLYKQDVWIFLPLWMLKVMQFFSRACRTYIFQTEQRAACLAKNGHFVSLI